ncbi:MAG: nucleotidyltransferase family protein [Clostridiales bacterium]|nr:nucleotidyltransferase family protein [Clostridiales bacterium]
MKIAAIIEEFDSVSAAHEEWIRQVRQRSGADLLIAVMSGDFLQQGLPARENKYIRAQKAAAAGVDLIIKLPVYCSLTSSDTYAFAAVSTLNRLNCVDELYIPCDTTETELLRKAAQFLFIESPQYQKEIRRLRASGLSFYSAQAKAVGNAIQGAGPILQDPVNIFAAEYLRALKRMYCRIKPCLIQAPGLSPLSRSGQTQAQGPEISDALSALVKERVESACAAVLNETRGGTSMLTDRILETRSSYETFESYARLLSTATRSPANIRRYLLDLLLGIRKSDMGICQLYSFALYARIIGCREPGPAHSAAEYLRSKAWIPVFLDTPADSSEEKQFYLEAEPSLQIMADIDKRAAAIHTFYSEKFSQRAV